MQPIQQTVTNLNATNATKCNKFEFNMSNEHAPGEVVQAIAVISGYPPAGRQSLTKCNKYECNMSLAAGEAFHRQ